MKLALAQDYTDGWFAFQAHGVAAYRKGRSQQWKQGFFDARARLAPRVRSAHRGSDIDHPRVRLAERAAAGRSRD